MTTLAPPAESTDTETPPVAVRAVAFALRPDVAVGVLVAVEVGGLNDAFGAPLPGLPSLHLLSLAYATFALAVGLARREVRPVWSPLFACWLLYAAVRGLSVALSPLPPSVGLGAGSGLGPAVEEVRSLVFLVVCTTLLCAVGRPRRIVVVATVAVAVTAAAAVVQEFVLGNTTELGGFSGLASVVDAGGATVRHTGPQPDANFWARTLVLYAPFAFALAASATGTRHARRAQVMSRARRARIFWTATALVFAAGVWLSGSRAAMLAFGLAVVVWFAAGGARRARWLVVAPLVFVVVLALPGVGSRLATLAGGSDADDPSLRGRLAAQTTAVTLISEYPTLGVGAGRFTDAAPEVLRRTGARTDRVLAPHNLYLEVTAETGVVGALTWLLCFGTILAIALRGHLAARRRLPDGVDDPDTLVLLGAVVGLVAWALCSATLHMANVRFLLVVAAVAIAYDRRVRERIRTVPRGRVVAADAPRRPTAVVAAVTVGTAVAAVVVAVTAAAAPTRWASAASLTVAPRDVDAGPYEYDLLSRGTVVATVAELLRTPGPAYRSALPPGTSLEVRRTVRPERSTVLTVVATGPDRRAVERLAPAAAARVSAWVDGLGTLYVAQPVAAGATVTVRAPTPPTLPVGAGLVAGLAAGLAVGAVVRRRQRAATGRAPAAHDHSSTGDPAASSAASLFDSPPGDAGPAAERNAPTRLPAP